MELNENESQLDDYARELKLLVVTYLERHPKLSINAFASRAGVSVSTLRRIVKEEKRVEVAPHIVLNLLSYIYKDQNLSSLILNLSDCLQEFLKKHFGTFIFELKKHSINLDLNECLQDKIKYFIYKLASNHCGTDVITVVEAFGQLGKAKLEELIEEKAVYFESGRFHASNKNFSLDIITLKKHLPELAKLYRPDKLSDGLNLCYNLSESLNEEAIIRIKKIKKECIQAVYDIMIDENNYGEIPYFSLFLSESMIYNSSGDLQ